MLTIKKNGIETSFTSWKGALESIGYTTPSNAKNAKAYLIKQGYEIINEPQAGASRASGTSKKTLDIASVLIERVQIVDVAKVKELTDKAQEMFLRVNISSDDILEISKIHQEIASLKNPKYTRESIITLVNKLLDEHDKQAQEQAQEQEQETTQEQEQEQEQETPQEQEQETQE